MDAMYVNGDFRTSDNTRPRADTVLAQDGRFTFVGSRTDAPQLPDVPVVDLGGRTVLPGLIDAHTHPATVAKSGWHVALPETDDLDEILDFVREYGQTHPVTEAPYLYFEYYPTSLFAESPPTKEMLDTAISDRPVLCQDSGDHASWVNTRMLELLGVDETTPDPVPGLERFARDEAGTPTGHIFEHAYAHSLPRMYDAIGWMPPEVPSVDLVAPVFEFLSRHGVTALFDAIVEEREMLEAVTELHRRGGLNMHYEGAVRFRSSADLPAAIDLARQYDDEFGSSNIRIRTVKLFLDGTNELGNSAVLDPLLSENNAGPLGAIQMESAELAECLDACNRARIDIHIHMVGDRAFRTACDSVETARQRASAAGEPWQLQVTFAHCELVDPADMKRPAELGVIVNWTNHWSGGYFGEEGKHHLGEERWNRMYDFTTIAEAGATLAFSSDVVSQAELVRANPFLGMQIAATRIDPYGPLDPARYPGSVRPSAESRLSVERLITGYTMAAAQQLRISETHGSISVGKLANMVVLNEDPYEVEPSRLGEVHPIAVVVEGRVVTGALPR